MTLAASMALAQTRPGATAPAIVTPPTGAVPLSTLPVLPGANGASAPGDAASNTATDLMAPHALEEQPPREPTGPRHDASAADIASLTDRVTGNVTVLSRDMLMRGGFATIAEALRATAGIVIANDPLHTTMDLRGVGTGVGNQRLLVLIDGAPVNAAWDGAASVGWDAAIAWDDIERIEIHRGPTTASMSGAAVAGVVHIVTRAATGRPHAWGEVTGASTGLRGAAGFRMGSRLRNVRGAVSGTWRRANLASADGVAAAEQDRLASGNVAISGRWDHAWGQLRSAASSYEPPYAPWGSDATVSGPAQRSRQMVVADVGYAKVLASNARLQVRGGWQRSRAQTQLDVAAPRLDTTTTGDANTFSALAEMQLRAWEDRLALTTGWDLARHDTRTDVVLTQTPSMGTSTVADWWSTALSARGELRLISDLQLHLGARMESHSSIGQRLSPEALLRWHRGSWGVSARFAEGYLAPTAEQRVREEPLRWRANTLLRAEQLQASEASAWWEVAAGAMLRVTAFHWRHVRPIDLVRDDVQPNDVRLTFQNNPTRTTNGVEAEGVWRSASGWFVLAGLRWVDRDVDFLFAGDATPWLSGNAMISTPRWHGVQATLLADGMTARASDVAAVVAPSFVQWHAALLAPRVGPVSVRLSVRNIMDTRAWHVASAAYQLHPEADSASHAASAMWLVPGEGRTFAATASMEF